MFYIVLIWSRVSLVCRRTNQFTDVILSAANSKCSLTKYELTKQNPECQETKIKDVATCDQPENQSGDDDGESIPN